MFSKHISKNPEYFGIFRTAFYKTEDYETHATSTQKLKIIEKNKRKIKSRHILIRNYKYTDYGYNFTRNFYAFNFNLRHFS